MAGLSVRSLVWSAFRRGGLVSVSVVACRRSRSGVALSFVFGSRVVALGFLRRWQPAGALAGGAFCVLVPVAGSVPFAGTFGPAGAHRAFWFPVRGVASLAGVASSLAGALL